MASITGNGGNGGSSAARALDTPRTPMQSEYTLQDLADLVQGDVQGDPQTVITGVRGLKEACEGDISFLANSKYFAQLQSTRATAVVISKEEQDAPIPMIRVQNPNYAFARIAEHILNKPIRIRRGVHPTAILGENVKLGANVTVHAYAVICDNVVIGDNTIIHPFCYIGHYTQLGRDCEIYPHVTVRERCVLGNRVMVHSGTVIGCDGFGYSTVKGVHHKIPQIGIVDIGDDVEIGANVTIDRARFEKTIIGKGTKVDNLVQIGHNVRVGENCFVIAQSGIAGSAKIGNNVILAGQSGVNGHIEIGDNVQVAGQSGVLRSVEPNARLAGTPAQPHDQYLRMLGLLKRMPEAMDLLKDLQQRITNLEQKTENDSNGS